MLSPFPAKRNERARTTPALLAAFLILSATPALAAERRFDCVIDPSETVKVGSAVAGILAEVLVKRGDVVTRGQNIARLESDVEATTVKFNRFRSESTAKIDAQKQRLALARARLERATELLNRKIVAQDKFEELSADSSVAQQELLREEQERLLAKLELERSEAVLRQRAIRSPIDGVVTEKRLSAGEYIHQEASVVTIARLDPLHVETFLPVATHGQIEVGMKASVYPDPPISGTYEATVSVVDRVFDPASGTYGVRMILSNTDHRLPGGQRCKVSFDLAAPAKKPAAD